MNVPQATPTRSQSQNAEAGYMLVAVVAMTAILLITLSIAAPVIAKDLRRDKEVESQHRAQQYVRAIRLYYRKTHTYPPSIDALKSTNNIRFLRQEYVDPLTGKSDWRLIHLGEQKTTIKGFFGQELGGIASSGLGSASGMNSGIGTPIGGTAGTSSTSTVGTSSPLASGFDGATITTSTAGSSGTAGSTGSTGLGGGGGAIIGVGTAKSGGSISTPNQQGTYETWEFWYDPRIEALYQKGKTNAGIGSGGLGSQPASTLGGTGFGTGGIGASTGSVGSTGSTSTTPSSTTPGSIGGPL